MPTPLNATQLTNLSSILGNENLTTDQRAASYYQTLGSYGYAYGTLAYGVATNSTPDGKIANAFTANYAAEHGIPYNATIASEIRFRLALQDLSARERASGNDLNADKIRGYHELVYGQLTSPLPIQAWASEVPIQLFGEEGWQDILGGVGGDALVGVGVALVVFTFATRGIELRTTAVALNWIGDISGAVASAGLGAINSLVQSGTITAPDGSTFIITPNSTFPDTKALQPTTGGQSYFYDQESGLSVYISSAALVGKERSYVSNPSGLLEFAARSGTTGGILELPDFTLVNNGLPSTANAKLMSISSDGASAAVTLTSYLSSIGVPTDTLAEIAQLHLDQLHPSAIHTSLYQSAIGLRSDGRVNVENYIGVNNISVSSANFAGLTTATTYNFATSQYVTAAAYNILSISGSGSLVDFSRSTLTNFQELQMRGGSIAMTAAQFNSFGSLSPTNYGTLHITTGGALSIAGKGIDPSWVNQFQIVADSQDGTTLTGENSSWLRASLFGNDTLNAGNGGGTLFGGYGANQLNGGTGADTFNLLAGQLAAGSNINGGSGTDTITSYASATDALDISRAAITGVEGLSINASTVAINSGQLGGFSTLQTGNTSGLMLVGSNAGTYNLSGKSITGTINLTGSAGDDVLVGGSTTKKLYGGAGNDRITYSSAAITIDGGTGSDTLVFAGAAPAAINLANATIGTTTITGVEGIDTSNATGALTITGDANANTIKGGIGADTLLGGDGDDTIVYDAADVLEDGGAGNDTLVLNQTVATFVNLTNTSDQVTGGGTTINFENIDGSGSTAALSLTGDGNANVIKGGSAADTLAGGAGDDTISYDVLDVSGEGGAGNDTLVLSGSTAISVSLSSISDQVSGGGLTTGFENIDGSTRSGALVLSGDANANALTGGVGDDVLLGNAGNDTLQGGAGNDYISGDAGVDTIYSGDGNDTVIYDNADTLVDGGNGTDTVLITASVPTTVLLTSTFTNFEIVSAAGSTAAVTIIGDAGANTLTGGAGADTLSGGVGNDTISYDTLDVTTDGGAGNDTLLLSGSSALSATLSTSTDQVTGGGLTTGFENVDASAMTAAATLTGDANANILIGGAGADTIFGSGGADSLYGSTGNDRISFGSAATRIDGGVGSDTLVVGTGFLTINLLNAANQVNGTAVVTGFENVDSSSATSGLSITGDNNDNVIIGGSSYDVLYGGVGNDTITYDALDYVVDGGADNDTLALNQTVATTVNLTTTLNQVVGGGAENGFENIDGTGSTAALTIFGNAGTNVIKGGAGKDFLYASAGGDQRYGGVGDDILIYSATDAITDGGAGVDWLALQQGSASINLGNVADQSSGDTAIVTGVENVDGLGNASALTILGDGGANFIRGGLGADTLSGGVGDDTMFYDAADVSIVGGAGNDTLYVNDIDSRAYKPDVALSIDLRSTINQATSGTTVVTGFENVDGRWSTVGLTMIGDFGNSVLRGGAGIDVISDAGGDDYIDGGAGADSLYGNGGDDTIAYDVSDTREDAGTGNDTLLLNQAVAVVVDLRNADQVTGGGDNGITAGFDNINALNSSAGLVIIGSTGNNILQGGSGNDVFGAAAGDDTIICGAGSDAAYGNEGNDTITGGTGNDYLQGDAGNDTYNFARGDGADTIAEFDATVGNKDYLKFASGVNYDQLWLKRVGDNLEVDVIGTTDAITVSGWYLSPDRQVESIQAGGLELISSNVINLVNAMAGMAPPGAGQTNLTTAQHTALDPVITANWHAAA